MWILKVDTESQGKILVSCNTYLEAIYRAQEYLDLCSGLSVPVTIEIKPKG